MPGRATTRRNIVASREKNPDDEDTCVACDSRTYCPVYIEMGGTYRCANHSAVVRAVPLCIA